MSVAWDDPRDVAEKHYKYLVENNFELWKETLMSYMKDALESSKGGSAGEYYWITGRRYVETHGIRYEFHKEETEHVSPDTKKYFFVRVKPSGEQMGYPLPITLKKDTDDKWKVDTATQ